MKIVVQLPNRSHQAINLVAPLKLVYGKLLNQLHSGDGTIYYFDHNGHYDGLDHTLPARETADEAYFVDDKPIDDKGSGH